MTDTRQGRFGHAGPGIATPDMDAKWYFSREGVKAGPVSSSKLRAMARSGELLETDLLWKEGMEQWRPAGDAGRLFRRRSSRRRDGGAERRQAAAPQPPAAEPSRFRAWALEAGCPASLLEPIPVAGAVAVCLLAIWLIVWLLMLASTDTAQLVNDVKERVIVEGGEAVTRAADAAKRGLIGDDGQEVKPRPAESGSAAAAASPAAEPAVLDLNSADF
jgi:hypothetical protein